MKPGLTIITPWFGTDAPGGAERLARGLAERMAARGWQVTLATTTNAGHHAWWEESNFAPGRHPWPGAAEGSADAPALWRFPPDPRNRRKYDLLNHKMMHRMPIQLAEEEDFFRQSINSRALLNWVARERPRDLVLVLPYLYGLCLFAAFAFAERVILAPCLHREGYARMRLVAEMLERARGIVFLSEEEQALGQALAAVGAVPQITGGAGVNIARSPGPATAADRAEARRKFARSEPYLLYVGWQDLTKGIGFLYECYHDVRRLWRERGETPPRLLLAGPGHVPIPPGIVEGVADLRYLTDADKQLALAGAEWLVQPSLHESFSFVMMESWLRATPVLANALCAVTRGHVVRARGGLYFASGEELDAAIQWGRANPALHAAMGECGRHYVGEHFDWELVAPRLDRFLAERLAESFGPGDGPSPGPAPVPDHAATSGTSSTENRS